MNIFPILFKMGATFTNVFLLLPRLSRLAPSNARLHLSLSYLKSVNTKKKWLETSHQRKFQEARQASMVCQVMINIRGLVVELSLMYNFVFRLISQTNCNDDENEWWTAPRHILDRCPRWGILQSQQRNQENSKGATTVHDQECCKETVQDNSSNFRTCLIMLEVFYPWRGWLVRPQDLYKIISSFSVNFLPETTFYWVSSVNNWKKRIFCLKSTSPDRRGVPLSIKSSSGWPSSSFFIALLFFANIHFWIIISLADCISRISCLQSETIFEI